MHQQDNNESMIKESLPNRYSAL